MVQCQPNANKRNSERYELCFGYNDEYTPRTFDGDCSLNFRRSKNICASRNVATSGRRGEYENAGSFKIADDIISSDLM